MPKDINGWQNITAPPWTGVPAALTSELHRALQRARQLGLEFLNTELDLAEAFLDLAETTGNAASCRRNMLNAVKALDAIARFLEHLSPELPQRRMLAHRTAGLRARLMACGSRLQPNG